MKYSKLLSALLLLGTTTVFAQNFTSDVTVTKADPAVMLIDEDPDSTDWTLCTDGACAGPAEGFNIAWDDPNPSAAAVPFSIETGAPDSLLYLNAAASVGINTSMPSPGSNLHVGGGNIFLDPIGTDGDWVINPGSQGLFFVNEDGSATNPVTFRNGAPSNSLVVDSNGRIGLGTSAPESTLEISDITPGVVLVDETSGSEFGLEFSQAFLRLKGRAGQDLGKIHTQAPVGTFTTDARGRTGYGTATPDASFNVKYRGAHGAVPIFLAQAANNDEIFRINLNGNAVLEGTLSENSDINAKTNIQLLDYVGILKTLSDMDIHRWQYKDARGVDHIGPMAQDFRAAFGLGDSDTQISTLDTSGVALAAIKALVMENRQLKEAHRQSLRHHHTQLEKIAELQAQVGALESQSDRIARLEALLFDQLADSANTDIDPVR